MPGNNGFRLLLFFIYIGTLIGLPLYGCYNSESCILGKNKTSIHEEVEAYEEKPSGNSIARPDIKPSAEKQPSLQKLLSSVFKKFSGE